MTEKEMTNQILSYHNSPELKSRLVAHIELTSAMDYLQRRPESEYWTGLLLPERILEQAAELGWAGTKAGG